jgi:HPt (histidine-containing phosphotransfer) domain-containing protein
MTANVMAEDKKRAKDAGMNGHVAKPVDPSELYKELARVIPVADYSANLPAKGTPEIADVSAAKANKKPSAVAASYPGLNTQQGLSRLAGNEKLYLELLWNLQDEYSNTAFYLASLLEAGDAGEARAIAHKLRGIANNLGAITIGECAEDIERLLIAEEAVSAEKIEALSDALTQVSDSIMVFEADQTTVNESATDSALNTPEVLSKLRQAITAADPTAIELIDQLLGAHKTDDKVSELLTSSRESLNNFDFAAAELLLGKIEAALLA